MTSEEPMGLKIQILFLPGCPGLAPTIARVKKVLSAEGIASPVELVSIPDEATAYRERFLGSPSVLINGLDIEEKRRGDPPCFGCRVYPDNSYVPSETLIRDALARAASAKLRILYLCTGNSCRSQMAEAWTRVLKGDRCEAYSAGIEARGLDPRAARVMAEVGIDISQQRSKPVAEVEDFDFDYIVTVCGHAHETCPAWLKGKAKVRHVGFDDPPALAKMAQTEEEALMHYRRVRDEIKAFCDGLPENLAD